MATRIDQPGTGARTPIPVASGTNQSAGSNTRNSSAKKLSLTPNVPELVALKFATGKIVPSNFGDEKQVYFSLVDGRSAYVSLGVAQKIYDLGLSNREAFYICRKQGANDRGYIDVWLTPEGERSRAQAAGTEEPSILERQLAASIREAEERKPAPGPVAVPPRESAPAPIPVSWSSHLVNSTNALVDAYAACLEHADKEHGNRVKPEDVRSLLQTVYIAISKGAQHAA